MKRCKKCGIVKPAETFNKNSRSKDSLQSWCRSCTSEYQSDWGKTKKGKESRLRAVRKYFQTDKGKANRKACDQRRKIKQPEKIKARDAARHAVQSGRLTKEPCPCGETKVQGHHEDYSKPLDVEWLCTKCHEKRKV